MQKMMRAVRIHQYGGPEVLVYEDAPVPALEDNDVLIKVHASSVNPIDWKIRQGHLQSMLKYPLPVVLGWDVAGEVVALGAKVSGWRLGDAVYSRPNIARAGSYAEFIAVDANEIAAKPASLSWQAAAAVPLTALTAWQALYDSAQLQTGERVLVHAGSGGVGSFAVQLAKARGAYVYTTTSTRNVDWVKQLGADEVIDYTQQDFSQLRNIDVVFDTLGAETQAKSWPVLRRGGRLVSIYSPPEQSAAEPYGATALFVFVQPNGTQLAQLAEMIDAGKLQVTIDSVYPLAEIAAAHIKSETGRARGKIVIEVIPE